MSRPTNRDQKPQSGSRTVQLKKAPPIYKPQPAPKVLQTKTSPQSVRERMVQPNAAIKTAPPAYRPNPTPLVLQMKTNRHTPHARLMVPVIQRMNDDSGGRSSSNAFVYSSVGQHYSPQEIEDAQMEALGQNLHGHQTGGVGSGVSQQTKTEMSKVVDVLRKNRAKAKAKKKQVIVEKPPMTGYQKAKQKALALLSEKGKDGLGDFVHYLDTRAAELNLTDPEADELVDLFK